MVEEGTLCRVSGKSLICTESFVPLGFGRSFSHRRSTEMDCLNSYSGTLLQEYIVYSMCEVTSEQKREYLQTIGGQSEIRREINLKGPSGLRCKIVFCWILK